MQGPAVPGPRGRRLLAFGALAFAWLVVAAVAGLRVLAAPPLLVVALETFEGPPTPFRVPMGQAIRLTAAALVGTAALWLPVPPPVAGCLAVGVVLAGLGPWQALPPAAVALALLPQLLGRQHATLLGPAVLIASVCLGAGGALLRRFDRGARSAAGSCSPEGSWGWIR